MKEAVSCFCLAVVERGAEKLICPGSHKWEGKILDPGVDISFHYYNSIYNLESQEWTVMYRFVGGLTGKGAEDTIDTMGP